MTWSIAQSSWQQLVTRYSQESKSSIILPVTISRKPLLLISNSYAAIKVLTIADTGNILGKWLKAALKNWNCWREGENVWFCEGSQPQRKSRKYAESLQSTSKLKEVWIKSIFNPAFLSCVYCIGLASHVRLLRSSVPSKVRICANAQHHSFVHLFENKHINTKNSQINKIR